jgi:hypothetical protein
MQNNLKLDVIFNTYVNSETGEILCKVPNDVLIDSILKNGLENSKLEYVIAYNCSYPNWNQYEVTMVELIKIISIENILVDGKDQIKINLEVLDAFCHHKFDVEFGPDVKMDEDVPKVVVIKGEDTIE